MTTTRRTPRPRTTRKSPVATVPPEELNRSGPAEDLPEDNYDPDLDEEESTDEEPSDPFNIDDMRYDEAEFHHGDVDAQKTITAIKVRKPHNAREWFMLHPSQDYQLLQVSTSG